MKIIFNSKEKLIQAAENQLRYDECLPYEDVCDTYDVIENPDGTYTVEW